MRAKAIISAFVILALSPAASVSAPSAASDPAQFVRELGDEVIGIIRAPGLDKEERRQRYLRLFEQKFDVERMARFALGRHWRRLSQPERQRYVRIFRDYVVRLYADRFAEYQGEQFSVVDRSAQAGSQWRVPARIASPDGSDINLTFVLERPKERFIIVDVVVEGVSLLITKRSEFESVIERKGIEGFLDDLESLTERMARSAMRGRAPGGADAVAATDGAAR